MRFWRPPLYQFELLAFASQDSLPNLSMQLVRSASIAKLLELQAIGGFFLVLGRRVVSILTFCALEGNDVSHENSSRRPKSRFRQIDLCLLHAHPTAGLGNGLVYSKISEIVPAPTVRPPSRIANRNPFSIAIGVINFTVNPTLSPGITISVPASNSATPVTSVVRK